MPRLNVYLPEDLAPLVGRWRARVNLSELCARSLRESLEALESGRTIGGLLDHLRGPTELESEVARKFGLRQAVIAPGASDADDVREVVAVAAANFLERTLADAMAFGVGGGRQMWEVVRRLRARPLRLQLAAIGAAQVDPTVLHAHPNTLVTLLWLLYSPRAVASLVGASGFGSLWTKSEAETGDTTRLVMGSCSSFNVESSFVRLLGRRTAEELQSQGSAGDFLGVFFDGRGESLHLTTDAVTSLVDGDVLKASARRADTIVALAAGGSSKHTAIRLTLSSRLCNTLITDESTARALIR